jgi:CheY-like chemotaxis protein
VPTDLPPLLADRSQLETVLVNLATNARDAIGETGVLTFTAAEVRVSEADRIGDLLPGDYIRLTTRDDGTGMDAATLARAAEPFFTTKRAGQGTGLGLAMARGFAGQSGGALLIESAPGAGTQVTLWLPRADTNVAEDAPPAPAPAVDRHLLLVEDSDLLRGLLASALEAQGYAVTPAANAAEALALLEHMNDTPDLLITDLSMPGMNGLELIRIVQERLPQIPAILLTGFVSDAASPAVREALRGNRFALLHKPVSERHLAERVAALLEVGNAAEVSD